MNTKVVVLLMGCLAIGSSSSFAAQKPAAKGVEARLRALEDKEAIHALLTTYGRTLDARDFAGFEQLFARDAEFVSGPTATAKGPAAIRALLEGLLKTNAAPVPGRDFHLFYNETIDVTGDEATALSKGAFVVRGQNNRLEMSILANYHDQLVREDGRWKFKRRQIGDGPPATAPATAAR
jgi:uncharacterized protein (TIGR02246 family)